MQRLEGMRVLVFVEDTYEDLELWYPKLRLAEEGAEVVTAEAVGLDGDSMEAEAWGYLAVRSLRGLPLTFPATTGVRAPVTGGLLRKAAVAG